jgi:hypothetical protein
MKNLSVLLTILLLSINAPSQTCLPNGIIFHTQAEIDSFQVSYPGCNVIEGDVHIGNFQNGTNTDNLIGLSVLESIGGSFIIQNNDSLTSLAGLENITTIGDQLGIFDNPGLVSMTGLDGLTYAGSLTVGSNANLSSLTGLENLVTVGSYFSIENSPSIVNLGGLESLTSVGAHASITGNDALVSLDGLDNLVTIGSGFAIEYNNALENIEALHNLVSVQNDDNWSRVSFKNNIALTSLAGFDNVDPASIAELSIGWNLACSECDVYSICHYLADPVGDVIIRYNAPGCNNIAEVEAACSVGIHESVAGGQRSAVRIYPNPSSKNITIELPKTTAIKNTNLSIYNLNGQEVLSKRITEQMIVENISDLPGGVYFITVLNDRTLLTGKFFKR